MVQRKRKISEIEKELKYKAINEVIKLTSFEENVGGFKSKQIQIV